MSCSTGMPDWSGVTLETFNMTLLLNPTLCTACTCPLEIEGNLLGYMSYFPSLAGNAVFAAVFGLILLPQVYLGIRYKTWGFLIAMVGALVLELLGYVARILLRDDMFIDRYFVMYLVCLTIAPAFMSAAIYLSLSRLVVIYAPERARFRPQVYTYIFIVCDVLALVLQATGGGMTAVAEAGSSAQDTGVNIMIAGVAWQVFALVLFALLSLEFWIRVRKMRGVGLNPAFEALRAQKSFQPWFIVAVFGAGLFIFIRSVFRCAELSEGFDGPLANDEVTFMVLEGTMIALASILLTVFHPGVMVGTEGWSAASWKAAKQGQSDAEKAAGGLTSSGSSGSERELRY